MPASRLVVGLPGLGADGQRQLGGAVPVTVTASLKETVAEIISGPQEEYVSPLRGMEVIATPPTVGAPVCATAVGGRPARARQQSGSSGRRRRARLPERLARFSTSHARGGLRRSAAADAGRQGRKAQPQSASSALIHRKAPSSPCRRLRTLGGNYGMSRTCWEYANCPVPQSRGTMLF